MRRPIKIQRIDQSDRTLSQDMTLFLRGDTIIGCMKRRRRQWNVVENGMKCGKAHIGRDMIMIRTL